METAPGTLPGISLPTVGSRGECLVEREPGTSGAAETRELCSEAIFVSPGLCQWPGWSDRCDP